VTGLLTGLGWLLPFAPFLIAFFFLLRFLIRRRARRRDRRRTAAFPAYTPAPDAADREEEPGEPVQEE
jgi:hypothetical protein